MLTYLYIIDLNQLTIIEISNSHLTVKYLDKSFKLVFLHQMSLLSKL
jgi:hypothetical protein